jgi:hypothetical protein
MPITIHNPKNGTISQQTYNPIDYGFSWTNDDWYEWDSDAAHKAARQARDAQARDLKSEGFTVRKFSIPSQLISRGGIGSGRAHVEFVVSIYGINVN